MHPRKWIRGDNGLWSSFDAVIQAQMERGQIRATKEAAKAERMRLRAGPKRIREIRERFAAVMERNGWERKKNCRRWHRKPAET